MTTRLMRKISDLVTRTGKTVDFYDRSGDTTYQDIKVTPPEGYKDKYIDGDIIKYGDLKVALSPVNLAFEPDLSDMITIDDVKWMVEEIDNIWIDDGLILYEMQVRKSGNTALTPSSLWTKIDKSLVAASFKVIEDKGIDATFHAASDYTRKVVTVPDFDAKMIDGDLIQEGDIRVHLPSKDLPFAPKSGIKVTYNDDTWLLTGEMPVYSGEQVCVYELQLRW